jgi:hypothetical protein
MLKKLMFNINDEFYEIFHKVYSNAKVYELDGRKGLQRTSSKYTEQTIAKD